MNLPPGLSALARLLRRDIRQVKEAIDNQTRAAHDASHTAQQEAKAEHDVIVSTSPDKQFVVEVHPKDHEGNALQKSIKHATWFAAWGTWGAVVAASIYAGIANSQLKEMQRTNEQTKTQWDAEHRPWVGSGEISLKNPPVFLVYPTNPPQVGTQVSFSIEIPIKNFGITPAFHVETELLGTMTEQIAAPPTMKTMMESACGWADGNSKNVGGVLFPNSPGTTVERNENIGTPLIQINQVHRIWIVICTAYGGETAGEKLHHTKTWMASWPINGQPTEIRRTASPARHLLFASNHWLGRGENRSRLSQ